LRILNQTLLLMFLIVYCLDKNLIPNMSSPFITSIGFNQTVQNQIQQDWSNREYIETIVTNIKKITDFINTFDLSCRSKLAFLDEKLTKLERNVDYLESRIVTSEVVN
jgi:uncharacterized protein